MTNPRLQTAMDEVKSTYKEVIAIGNEMIAHYTGQADSEIKFLLENIDSLSNEMIRNSLLKISLVSYSFSEVKEKSALKADIAETLRKEKYANEFLLAEGSVATKDNTATIATSGEIVTDLLFSYVSSALKTKLDEQHRVVDTLKSVLISRQSEAKLLSVTESENE